jgi:hypothetical protein
MEYFKPVTYLKQARRQIGLKRSRMSQLKAVIINTRQLRRHLYWQSGSEIDTLKNCVRNRRRQSIGGIDSNGMAQRHLTV